MNILLATNNQHKAEEIEAILSDLKGVSILTLSDHGQDIPEPVEDGTTLEANAWIKAKEIHDATGLPVLADDTGLEVDALDGAPGVYSARYAGDDATYNDNCNALLDAMKGAASRTARFRTVICYVDSFRTLFAEGEVKGVITQEKRGEGGFGYDPIFRPEESEKTFAEMSSEEKNQISHRGRALRNFHSTFAPYVSSAEEREDA
ncbi:MAG: RdgB/HAM1 family non-canonical purine NTP pyrophosphatase [Ignavibacteriae bacterium]|nr:RdgB/HAM1 family non-canonical purine NTP pyrophosphatase [Ignavibacteriota bacterium]MCB9214710.1 RdgB/HAM1 family non-canonical purine NTP pyrophosphatase [Ignavibacteria bacterium]